MTTINILNNGLSGSTGSGAYAGSTGGVFTGNVDFSGTSETIFPNSSSPTLNTTGQLAVDTSVTGYPGLLQYYSGSEILIGLGMLEADLVATDTYAIKYNAAGSKLVMAAQSGAGSTGKLQQYIIQTFTANDNTTSTSAVNTSVTASITPTNASSKILIMCSGYASVAANGGASTANIVCTHEIRRTTGTAATLMTYQLGKNLQDVSSTSSYPYYSQLCISAYETAGDTSTHTYIVRHFVATSNVTSYVRGDLTPSIMILAELLP